MTELKKMVSYKDLVIWQKSMSLVTAVYTVTKTFPDSERFGITSQINRAAVSVPANVAEGWGRESSGSHLQFLKISRASLLELETLLIISSNLGYIKDPVYTGLSEKVEECIRIINGFIKSVGQKITVN